MHSGYTFLWVFILVFLKDQRTFETVELIYLYCTSLLSKRHRWAEVWFVCGTCFLLLVLGQHLFYTVSREPACSALHCSFPESPFTYTQHWECSTALTLNIQFKLNRREWHQKTSDLWPCPLCWSWSRVHRERCENASPQTHVQEQRCRDASSDLLYNRHGNTVNSNTPIQSHFQSSKIKLK